MKIRRIPMTVEEYLLLPFEPGWKIELAKGVAVFQPREAVAVGVLEVAPRAVRCDSAIRPVVPDDAPELLRGFDAAFRDSVDYCGWSRESLEKERLRVVEGFFSGHRGTPLPASRVAIVGPGGHEDGAIAGAALVAEHDADSARLDLLFVRDEWRRHGLATALLAAALNALAGSGKRRLIATWMLANAPAVAWYRKAGFREEPDLMNARLYLRAATQELRRLGELGILDDMTRAKLLTEKERWEREAARLEELAAQGDGDGAFALHRFRIRA